MRSLLAVGAPLLLHVGDEQHVGRRAVELEVVADALLEHRRREGAEALAVLDLEVHHRLHLRRARVAEDRARAERPRPELHAPLAEADDVLLGDEARDASAPSRSARAPRRAARARRGSRGSAPAGTRGRAARRSCRRGRRCAARAACRNRCGRRRAARPARRRRRPPRAGSRGRRRCPARSSLPLATQLSATPPARQRFRLPVSSRAWRARRKHHLLADELDRGAEVHLAAGDARLGLPRRAAEERARSARWSSPGRRGSRSSPC